MIKGKALAELYFTMLDPEKDTFICKCGIKRQKRNGYSNLVSHIVSDHPEHSQLGLNKDENQKNIVEYFVPKKAKNLYGWMRFLVMSLLPFNSCENKFFNEFSTFDSIDRCTFKKYLYELFELVRKKISSILPDVFAIIFDGWSHGITHYLGIFATFSSNALNGYNSILLAFSPLENEESLNADEHIKFLDITLDKYQKSWENVACLIGDNCSTNRSIARKMKKSFVGCASHRFNLAVKDYLKTYENILSKVNELMKKLKKLVPSAKLAKFTKLRAKTRNCTRWSSCFEMLKRYKEIKNFLPLLLIPELDELLPSTLEDREINNILVKLNDLESITKTLQREDINLNDVRCLFDEVIQEYPETATRLAMDSSIVEDSIFENAVIRILDNDLNHFTPAEYEKTLLLRKGSCEGDTQIMDSSINLAERALKRKKLLNTEFGYIDVRFIRPTSNICERFFSIAGNCMSIKRESLLSSSFEAQMFLKFNCDFWDINDVKKMVLKE